MYNGRGASLKTHKTMKRPQPDILGVRFRNSPFRPR